MRWVPERAQADYPGGVRTLFGRVYAAIAAPLSGFWAFFFGMLIAVPVGVVGLLLRKSRKQMAPYAMLATRGFAWGVGRLTLLPRITLVGHDNLPRRGPYLVISNHRSWADVPLMIWLTRSQAIAKKQVLYFPFIGQFGWLSGTVFFDRSKPDARKRVLEDVLSFMEVGNPYNVYPEGGRTRTGHIRERVHLRLVESCHAKGVPVVPAVLWGTEDCIPVGGFYCMPFTKVGLQIAEPVDPAGFESAEAFATHCWGQVVAMAEQRGVA